jgi:ABC-type transport system involved in multi-copper enzyme maturation permease subunit
MMNIRSHSISNILSLTWLVGAIFDKEMRISSRRKRNYLLRFVYLGLLIAFVAGAWLSIGQLQGSLAMQKSRMATAGKSIVTTIVTFQFIATHIIAVIMLSNSISDEIYHRTLGVLMTTPITSFQIVIGKLCSKLLQIILLLSVSVPLMAVVRFFGGIPWDYIISSLFITITTVIFAGTLSLFFSISNRHSYVVIIKSVFTLGTLFLFAPAVISSLLLRGGFYIPGINSSVSTKISSQLVGLLYFNPYGAMTLNTAKMLAPTSGSPIFFWPVHCFIMLVFTAIMIVWSVKIVRRVALSQAVGLMNISGKKWEIFGKYRSNSGGDEEGIIKEVSGSPILWKELRAPLIKGGEGRNSKIGLAISIFVLLITYGICAKQKLLYEDFTHQSYTMMFVILGSIFNMIFASTCITTEKESGTWPLLIATSLSDWQIIIGKALGVFYRSLVVWLMLAGHILIFTLVGYIHPIAIIQLLVILTGLSAFLIGVGVYCSLRFRRTTSAIVANFAFTGIFWGVLPIFLQIGQELWRAVFRGVRVRLISNYVTYAQPLYQISVVMSGSAGRENAKASFSDMSYNWAISSIEYTNLFLLIVAIVYIGLGMFFAWRGKRLLRKNIF